MRSNLVIDVLLIQNRKQQHRPARKRLIAKRAPSGKEVWQGAGVQEIAALGVPKCATSFTSTLNG
jgi:hypothetical protein